MGSHVPATKATLDIYVKQSLIIVRQLTAVEMDDVEIHLVGSHVPATKATLDRHVKQSLTIVSQLTVVEMDDV